MSQNTTILNNSHNRLSSHPLSEDKEEMISLWQITFQDSDEFADLFFSRVYRPENTLVIKNEGKIVSALQMIPYEIKIADSIIPSAYICGVCTLTLERGKGYMKTLMNEAIDDMCQKGYGISTLIPAHPWLFDVYKNFGYIHPINYCLEYYTREVNFKSSDYTFIPYSGKYFPYFDKKQRERQCTVLHNEYDVENIISDLINDNGNAWIALYEDTPVGIAFVNPISENDVVIKEMLYENTQTKEALINYILGIFNAQTAKIRIHSQGLFNTRVKSNTTTLASDIKKTHRYGLACILDNRIAVKDLHMTLMLD